MQYYSTEHKAPDASLQQAVVQGLAEDRGLYMPERIPALSAEWIRRLPELSFVEIGQEVAAAFFGGDIPRAELDRIVAETLSFDCPAVPMEEGIYALELFHGPTLAFKDVGARLSSSSIPAAVLAPSRRPNSPRWGRTSLPWRSTAASTTARPWLKQLSWIPTYAASCG